MNVVCCPLPAGAAADGEGGTVLAVLLVMTPRTLLLQGCVQASLHDALSRFPIMPAMGYRGSASACNCASSLCVYSRPDVLS